jgi:hypothetical protein
MRMNGILFVLLCLAVCLDGLLTSCVRGVGDATSQSATQVENSLTPDSLFPHYSPRQPLTILPPASENAHASHGCFQESVPVVSPRGPYRPHRPPIVPIVPPSSPSPPLMSTSLTLQPFTDLIRHGKHARAAQSVDPSPADGHPNARDQRLHDHQQGERDRTAECDRTAERDRDRDRERHEHIKDKAQTKEVAEAIVKEEKAAKERMPSIKGLERFRILAKMGECVSSPSRVAQRSHAPTAVHFHTYTRPSIPKPARKSPVSRAVLRHISSGLG